MQSNSCRAVLPGALCSSPWILTATEGSPGALLSASTHKSREFPAFSSAGPLRETLAPWLELRSQETENVPASSRPDAGRLVDCTGVLALDASLREEQTVPLTGIFHQYDVLPLGIAQPRAMYLSLSSQTSLHCHICRYEHLGAFKGTSP